MNRALIFDMDGVLVHNDKYHCESWRQFAFNHGYQVSYDEVKSWFGNTNEMIIASLFKDKTPDKAQMKKLAGEKEALYRELYAPDIKALPGLEPLLQEARKLGWIIGLATAAPGENVDFVLDATGLKSYFQVITDASMISRGKPDPEIYELTAARASVLPRNCIVFEDSFHGIEAAESAGMNVVAVATTHPRESFPDHKLVIENFTEITISKLLEAFKTERV